MLSNCVEIRLDVPAQQWKPRRSLHFKEGSGRTPSSKQVTWNTYLFDQTHLNEVKVRTRRHLHLCSCYELTKWMCSSNPNSFTQCPFLMCVRTHSVNLLNDGTGSKRCWRTCLLALFFHSLTLCADWWPDDSYVLPLPWTALKSRPGPEFIRKTQGRVSVGGSLEVWYCFMAYKAPSIYLAIYKSTSPVIGSIVLHILHLKPPLPLRPRVSSLFSAS